MPASSSDPHPTGLARSVDRDEGHLRGEVERPTAFITSAFTAVVGVGYLALGVRSFRAARAAREAAAEQG